MCKAGLLAILMLASVAQARVRTVAVIDSGYSGGPAHICSHNNYDLVARANIVGNDLIGHGTQVANAIAKGNRNYCIYVFRIFNQRHSTIQNYVPEAIAMAIKLKVDIINLSLEGSEWNDDEFRLINAAVSQGIKVFVASGNGDKDLDIKCNVYPACYPIKGMIVVGTYQSRTVANYGHVVNKLEDWCAEGLCGTSLSTAIASRNYLKGLK